MSEKVYAVPAAWKKKAWVDEAGYKKMYDESVKSPVKFWGKQAKRLDWFKAPPRSRTHPSRPTMSRSSGMKTVFSTSPTTASTAT